MLLFLLTSLLQLPASDSLLTPFEKGNGNQTCTYEECINYYELLTKRFDICKLETFGTTSIGKPLHLFTIDKDKKFTRTSATEKNKVVLFINNGIHPGEPDGIDASMMFARDVLMKGELRALLNHCVIVIIPAYNISGMLNRNSTLRVNQNGPESYGFRANRQYLDLNRDFIKCDSKEALTFNEIFSLWSPEIFLDTHVTNGADYQYVMTYVPTHPDKLHPLLANYERVQLIPELEKRMKDAGFEMTPYVNLKSTTPDSGIISFFDSGRYSTGYAAMHNCIGFMPESHMLKPYKQRVTATYTFLLQTLNILYQDADIIVTNKRKADDEVKKQKEFVLQWQLNEKKVSTIPFKGYEAEYSLSSVTGLKQIHYNRSKPFTKDVFYYANYIPRKSTNKPIAYLIPQCYEAIIERLQKNGVLLQQVKKDTSIELSTIRISQFSTSPHPSEGHYPHEEVDYSLSNKMQVQIFKGDCIVLCNQSLNHYIIETLEPDAEDSFFTWNFFDATMQRKEYFSAYVFEPLAETILRDNMELRNEFEQKKKTDTIFAGDAHLQLKFIYERSQYAEPWYKIYPIYRLNSESELNSIIH